MVGARRKGDPDYIGPFRLLARLGIGGFGTVYGCAHRQSGELAAVKVVHPHLADASDFRSRFAREVAAIKRVHSDFVPRLIDEQGAADPAWLATELIPGLSLDKVVTRCGPLPETAVWQLGVGIAEALTAIHGAHLVHRDLKPQNVLLVQDRPWIIDFGLVHLSDLPHQSSSRLPMATYQYAAPEQLKSGLLGAGVPADVFALGGTLLFAATGHAPHEADGLDQLFFRAINAPPNLAGLPHGLYGLVENCLLRSPDARPPVADLRSEFARRTGDRHGFAAVLPPDVIGLLDAYREELADRIQAYGPARLGWRALPDGEGGGGPGRQLRLPEIGRLEEPITRADTGIVTRTSSDRAAMSASARHRPVVAPQDQPLRDLAFNLPPDEDDDTSAFGASTVSVVEAPVWHRGVGTAVRDPSPVRWTGRFDSVICAPVALHRYSGCVVVCLDGTVAGLRASDGLPLWRQVHMGPAVNDAAVVIPQAFGGGGDAFVGVVDGSVRAVDLASGWDRTVLERGAAIEGPLVAVGHRVYVLRSDGSLYVIDARTDRQRLLLVMEDGASGALAATADTVFAADTKGSVHVIDAATGRELRQVRTAGRVLAAPLPLAGRLYVAGTDAMLREVGLEDGDECEPIDLGAPVHASPVFDAGVLYVGDANGFVHAFDVGRRGGRGPVRRWPPCQVGAEITGLAVADGLVYVAAGYHVMEIDGVTGALRRELLQLNCLVGAAPVISGSLAYVVGLGGVVKCLTLR